MPVNRESIHSARLTHRAGPIASRFVPGLLVVVFLLAVAAAASEIGQRVPAARETSWPKGAMPVRACRLSNPFHALGLGFPRPAGRIRTAGEVRVTVLFVDFPDAVATRTPQEALGLVSPVSEAYFSAVSYGRLTLIYEPVLRWIRMRQPSTTYGINVRELTFDRHEAYLQEAIDLAGASVDYRRADGLFVFANPDSTAFDIGPTFIAPAGAGVTAGGRTFRNAVTSGHDLLRWGPFWANHELGHTLGLPDLYHRTSPQLRWVGMYSLMGLIAGPARELFAFERWGLGWVDDAAIVCAGSGETRASLTPVERPGGTKMIVVPVSTTAAVVAESRRVDGYDARLSPGVLVYVVDTSIETANGPIRVLPIDERDVVKRSATLAAGMSLTYQGVTVTVVDSDEARDVVRVVR